MTNNLVESNERRWFTMIPHIVDDMGLDPYAYRLYGHLRRVAGENGACWQSTDTLAEHCKMSAGSVSNAKTALADAGLIKIEHKTKNGTRYHHITIIDVWAKNRAAFTDSPEEDARSPGETKKNPDKNFTSTTGDKRPGDLPYNFEGWFALVKNSSNKQAVIARMVATLFPDSFPDGIPKSYYGRVAKTAKHKNIGAWGRLVQLVWQANGYRPTGDVLSYCIGIAQNGGRPLKQEGAHPGDSVTERNGKRVMKVGI
jgi:hypothetical protein